MNTIQTNLEALNLQPLPKMVKASVGVWDNELGTTTYVEAGEWSLEDLCLDHKTRHMVYNVIKEKTGNNEHFFGMKLEGPDGFKATLSSDGNLFLLERDLRMTYLTLIVSEWGKDHTLNVAEMVTDKAVTWMLEYVRTWYEEHPLHYNKDGTVQEYHHSEGETANRFMYALTKDGMSLPGEFGVKDFFRYGKETQFGDGYCGAVGPLWGAACWELFGEQREYPYRFCY